MSRCATWQNEDCPTCGMKAGAKCRDLTNPRRNRKGSHPMRSPFTRQRVEIATRRFERAARLRDSDGLLDPPRPDPKAAGEEGGQ